MNGSRAPDGSRGPDGRDRRTPGARTSTPPAGRRPRWRHSIGRHSIGRHPRGIARVATAGAAVTLCTFVASTPTVNPLELAVLDQVRRLPESTEPFWYALTWVGSPVAVGVAATLALYLERIRLGLKLAGAGAAAWGIGHLMAVLVDQRRASGAAVPDGLPAGLPDAFSFPAVHVAVAAALTGVAGPYLARRPRDLAWVAVALVGVADVQQALHLPVGVLAGGFLGWGVAASAHLFGGAPGKKTSEPGVVAALAAAGLRPERVETIREHFLGPVEMEVVTGSGDKLRTEVIRRLHRHAGPLYKARRLLASLEVEDEPPLSTPRHEAEHEAFVSLLAERSGVRTPRVVLARELEHGPALLVRVQVQGKRLGDLDPAEAGDELLDEIWRQVTVLGDARIAHHDLRASTFLIDTEGRPWILDLTFARAGAGIERVAQDRAVTMVSLAAVVGAARTLDSARRVLPWGALEEALPYLQSLALPRRVRRQLDDERHILAELRDSVAEFVGSPPPAFRSPIRPATALSLAAGGGAVYLLLPQLSSLTQVTEAIADANYGWLAAAFFTGVAALPAVALAFLGASRDPLPFWRTTAVQVAAAFAGRTTPGGAGFFGLNFIYLERLGIRRASSVSVLVLNRAGLGLVAALLSLATVVLFGLSGLTRRISPGVTGWPIPLAVGIAVAVAGIVVGSHWGRRRILHPTVEVVRELLSTMRQPTRALMLLGGSAGFLLLNGLGLAAALAAFHANFSVTYAVGVFAVGFVISQAVPTPGNLGSMEAVLVAGLVAAGTAVTTAVAAVLTFRLLAFWLPVLPGIAMFRHLQRRGVI